MKIKLRPFVLLSVLNNKMKTLGQNSSSKVGQKYPFVITSALVSWQTNLPTQIYVMRILETARQRKKTKYINEVA